MCCLVFVFCLFFLIVVGTTLFFFFFFGVVGIVWRAEIGASFYISLVELSEGL